MNFVNSTLDIIFSNIRAYLYLYLSALVFILLFLWIFGVKAILTTVAACAFFVVWVIGITGDDNDDDDWFGTGDGPWPA